MRDRSVARTTSGTFGFGKKHVEMAISVADNLVFLYPNATTETDGDESSVQTPQAIFIVSITLSIPEGIAPPPPIESLEVRLTGLESLGFMEALEQNQLVYASKKVEDATSFQVMPGNAYRWEVPVQISHDAAPYECMNYGRVLQKMKVRLEWAKTSWLSGLRTLETEKDVWMTCIPRTNNLLDYARTHRSFVDALGIIIFHFRTHHMTVGGYLRFGLSLPSVAPGCKVVSMTVSIIQATSLHSRKRPGAVSQCNPEKIEVHRVEEGEMRAMMTSTQSNTWLARIPACNRLRPSTLEGSTDAAIRVSHKLEIAIIYDCSEMGTEKPLLYTARWPLTIPSCSCRWRSLKLPSYSKDDPSPVPPPPTMATDEGSTPAGSETAITIGGRHHTAQDLARYPHMIKDCACAIPMKEILQFEDEFEEAQQTCLIRLMREEMAEATAEASHSPEEETPMMNVDQLSLSAGMAATSAQRGASLELTHSPEEEQLRQRKAAQSYQG